MNAINQVVFGTNTRPRLVRHDLVRSLSLKRNAVKISSKVLKCCVIVACVAAFKFEK